MATQSEMIEEILTLRGTPQEERPAKREILRPYDIQTIAIALDRERQEAGQREGAEQILARASRRSRDGDFLSAASRKSRKDQREAAKAAAGGAPSAAKKRSRKSMPKSLKARASRLSRAIKTGKIEVKRGLTKPADAKGKDRRSRTEAFVKAYEGVRAKGRSRMSRKSLKTEFKGISGKKFPYYVVHGFRVPARVVGGGRRGPGVIRPIPGSNATPFMDLSDAKKREVVAFLNSEAGKALRSKGAPAEVNLSAVVAAHAESRRSTPRRSSEPAGASANRRSR